MLQKTNTKSHWTALAVARYYEIHGTAVRARDLYDLEHNHDKPERLVATLSRLNDIGVLDAIPVMSPASKGGETRTHAYYPTNITIETLRDLEEPTKYPDGRFVQDDQDVTIPTDRVTASERPDPPTNIERLGLEYTDTVGSDSSTTRTSTNGSGEITSVAPNPDDTEDHDDTVRASYLTANPDHEPVIRRDYALGAELTNDILGNDYTAQ